MYTQAELAEVREAMLYLSDVPQLAGIAHFDVFAKGDDPDQSGPIMRHIIHTDGDVYVEFY